MPHFFLMDEDNLEPIEAAKIRCQLHIRGGLKLFELNKITHGIGTLYDAIFSAMRYYAHRDKWELANEVFHEEESLNAVFIEKNIFPSSFDFLKLKSTSEMLIDEEIEEGYIDKNQVWKELEEIFTILGVYPFDPSTLPEDDEDTRNFLGY
jgi:hypothetical protein